jgi:hypothetical protein
MRNLLALLATLALTFGGLGWYLDWYKIQSTPTGPGRTGIQIDFDKKKIGEDVSRGIRTGEEKLHDLLEAAEPAETTKAAAGKDEETPSTNRRNSVWPLRLFGEPTEEESEQP